MAQTFETEDPFIKTLDMTLSEAYKKYGSRVLVAISIASGQTEVTDAHWNMYEKERMKLVTEVEQVIALRDLIALKQRE